MELLADRFLIGDRSRGVDPATDLATDLATERHVEIVMATAGGISDIQRWEAACARFARVRHRVLAPLVDYGLVGEARMFEAWRCDGPWCGALDTAVQLCRAAEHLVRGPGQVPIALDVQRVRLLDGHPVVIPDASSGHELADDEDGERGTDSHESVGLELLPQGSVLALADLLREHTKTDGRVFALWGPRGSGLHRAAEDLARHARASGYVPVAASALDAGMLARFKHRSLCLIVRGDPHEGWRRIVECALRTRGPHVAVFVSDRSVPGVRPIPLDRFSPDALVAAVRPVRWARAHRERLLAAAQHAQGMPGRFAAALWLAHSRAPFERDLRLVRAAEQPPPYGANATGAPATVACAQPRAVVAPWPVAADLALHRLRLDRALADLERGHHARGERGVRELVGCLTRRCDWPHAARGALALADALLRRGRLARAQAALSEALSLLRDTPGEDQWTQAAILSGVAAVDALSLDEGEAVLHTALRAARGLDQPAHQERAALALARCLFWRGRYDQAERVLAGVDAGSRSAAAIEIAIERSRLNVGRGDITEAIAQSALAGRLAGEQADPRRQAAAACASAFVHLAIGDYRSTDDALERAVRLAARGGSAWLQRVRLLLAESLRRQSRSAAAARVVARLSRLARAHLPEIVRVRVDLAVDLLRGGDAREIGARHARAAGAPALALFVPASPPHRRGPSIDQLLELLRLCQTAAGSDQLLSDVCLRLREDLSAAAVGFFAGGDGAARVLAGAGGRLDPALAIRVLAAAQSVPPHATRLALEGGVPVRYGGRTVGALVARWTAGGLDDPGERWALLEAAAVAAAPALAERVAERAAPAASVSSELLGVSQAMREVRLAVDRAAAAPFPVLVEGESGCGKELVARALHRRSPRRDRPSRVINCASLPDELIDSELFGHARGAFTGAMAERPGVFEDAHTGTLFLDEIGELSLRAQAKVLRAIQEGEVRRVGENIIRHVDVRLIAATNRNLRAEAAAGRFRADLLYRLDVVRIVVPALRDRREDIPLLAEHFWREAAARVGSRATLGAAALAALARYDWPGNVRELQNVLAALAVRASRRGVVPPSALPPPVDSGRGTLPLRLAAARCEFDARFVRDALARTGGRRIEAARELGVTRQGLSKLLTRLGITVDEARAPAPD